LLLMMEIITMEVISDMFFRRGASSFFHAPSQSKDNNEEEAPRLKNMSEMTSIVMISIISSNLLMHRLCMPNLHTTPLLNLTLVWLKLLQSMLLMPCKTILVWHPSLWASRIKLKLLTLIRPTCLLPEHSLWLQLTQTKMVSQIVWES
jgi:hypothetical protein